MTWSRAAAVAGGKASAAKRRHRAAAPSHKRTPVTWYHGGPQALRGGVIKLSHRIEIPGLKKRANAAFATSDLRNAMVYAGQATFEKPGRVYKVKLGAGRKNYHRDPVGSGALHVGVRGRLKVIGALPVAVHRPSTAWVKKSRTPLHKRVVRI